jgi:hypothetical protein
MKLRVTQIGSTKLDRRQTKREIAGRLLISLAFVVLILL